MTENTNLLVLFLVMNIAGFVLMGIDKSKAKRREYRIKESRLWLIAILGGAVGATCGMKFFRHKTKHRQFKIGFPILAIMELIVFIFWLK